MTRFQTTIKQAGGNGWLAVGDKIELVNGYSHGGRPEHFVKAATQFNIGTLGEDPPYTIAFINADHPIDDPRYFSADTAIYLYKDISRHDWRQRVASAAEGYEG